jgi:chromosomal replication initiation ATPase DnaA
MSRESIVDIATLEMTARFAPKITVQQIFDDCCLCFNAIPDEVRTGNRTWYNTKIRKITSLVALYTGSFNLQEIADTIGYLNHTSIISNKKKAKLLFETKDSIWMHEWNRYILGSKVWPLIK